jgi:hypothetical protein
VLHDRLAKLKFFDPERWQKISPFEPPAADVVAALDKIEHTIGILPMSMRAFCEHVGSVRFLGSLKKSTGTSHSLTN